MDKQTVINIIFLKNKKTEKGITMVTLLITIILLLILAGVSINLIINGNILEDTETSENEVKSIIEQQQSRINILLNENNQIKQSQIPTS